MQVVHLEYSVDYIHSMYIVYISLQQVSKILPTSEHIFNIKLVLKHRRCVDICDDDREIMNFYIRILNFQVSK